MGGLACSIRKGAGGTPNSVLLRNSPDLSAANVERIHAAESCYLGLLYGILQDGIRHGAFVDRPLPVMLHALIQGAFSTVLWFRADGALQQEEIVEALTDQLMASVVCCLGGTSAGSGRPATP